jgi:hypothetical protein
MGMVLEFPADATMRRLGVATGTVLRGDAATILILPVVRVERHPDEEDEAERPDAGEESAGLPRQRPRR